MIHFVFVHTVYVYRLIVIITIKEYNHSVVVRTIQLQRLQPKKENRIFINFIGKCVGVILALKNLFSIVVRSFLCVSLLFNGNG